MNTEANLENGSRMFLEVMLTFCIMNSNIIKKTWYIVDANVRDNKYNLLAKTRMNIIAIGASFLKYI